MLYCTNNGNQLSAQQAERHMQSREDSHVIEVKDVDNHSYFSLFRLGTRVNFKGVQKGWESLREVAGRSNKAHKKSGKEQFKKSQLATA